ncbi:MAG: hypothetical protein A3C88_01240 [Candidatus Yanofskybacteria bacterium RIFCSPHIGHO2_02_FULL_50_12]|uniref:Uncharacterized protein n=1 Tax=Candidatus Yanofskybacteria bacterium RIFCSPHIGHO2_02_FULL_50_12 TaxID=1802685 RepID=A0A1F8FVQ8_9BACT|nr:MAG: hypothetical protein A3C88_01240 [Candidatus Yanofskybacteria bacterium RIFCSPHIGHO2_02_FULL_50_12]
MDDNQKPGQQSNPTQNSIDDLVKELSRPQTAPAPGAIPPAGGIPRPSAPLAPTPTPLTPPKPVSSPKPVPPPNLPKEYQSNIRTMADDISKIKAGQQPQGVPVPRKIEPSKPPAPSVKPSVPTPPAPPTGGPKISMPAPLAAQPLKPSMPPKPVPVPVPVPPPAPAPKSETPPAPASSGNRVMMLMALLAVVVLGGVAYWYFMIRTPVEVAIETPTPTATSEPTATPILGLAAIFPERGGAIILPPGRDTTPDPNTSQAFRTAFEVQPLPIGKFSMLGLQGSTASASQSAEMDIWDLLLISGPSTYRPIEGADSAILLFKQTEGFDASGKSMTSLERRLVLISEVESLESVNINEGIIPIHFAGIFGHDPNKSKGSFLETNYQGVTIRYKNFPYPDRSLDYAVIPYQDKNYLVLAGSREAMFATIDAFLVPGK